MTMQHLFAAGWNNVAGLTALHQISPPLFDFYRDDVVSEWHGAEEFVLNGERERVPVGLPWVAYTFPALLLTERQLMRTTFFVGTARQANVTIQTYNEDLNAFLRYNGVMRWPDSADVQRHSDMFWDYRIVIDSLRLYSGFSSGVDPLGFGV